MAKHAPPHENKAFRLKLSSFEERLRVLSLGLSDPRFREECTRLKCFFDSEDIHGQYFSDVARALLATKDVAMQRAILKLFKSVLDKATFLAQIQLESELLAVADLIHPSRHVVARYGLDGSLPKTLQKSGDIYGITRERVRQSCERFTSKMPLQPIYLPVLDACLAHVESAAIANSEQLSAELLALGRTERLFPLRSLSEAARLFNRRSRFKSLITPESILVVPTTVSIEFDALEAEFRRLTVHRSVCSLQELKEGLSANRAEKISTAQLRSLIDYCGLYVWLDIEKNWFRSSKSHPRCKIKRRALIAASSGKWNHIKDIYEGVFNGPQQKNILLPFEIFANLSKDFPFVFSGSVVQSEATEDELVYSSNDKALMRAFKGKRLAARSSLLANFKGESISEGAFCQRLFNSCCVARTANLGWYRLRGFDTLEDLEKHEFGW